MKFIWWTLVYWGLYHLANIYQIYSWGGIQKYNAEYSVGVRFCAIVVTWFLYFYLYIRFVKPA